VHGHSAVLSYLLQIALAASSVTLTLMLFSAGAIDHLAAAQLLRAHGSEWPNVLSMDVGGELKQWEGTVLEWARAEGCTSPLE
jgi:hypothetical protein